MKPHFFMMHVWLFCCSLALANEQEPCYELLRSEGIALYEKGDFITARDRFESAGVCQDKPVNHDLNEWYRKATNKQIEANEAAIIEKEKARQREQELKEQALRSAEEARRQARLTEANRRALLSNLTRDEKNYKEALYLAFSARKLFEGEVPLPIQQAFAQAAFHHYSTSRELAAGQPVTEFQWLPGRPAALLQLGEEQVALLQLRDLSLKPIKGPDPLSISYVAAGKEMIMLCAADGKAQVFSADGNYAATINAHEEYVVQSSFAPTGETILTSSRDNSAKLWSRQGNLIQTLGGHAGNVYEGLYASTGDRLLTRSSDGAVHVWDAAGQPIRIINRGSIYTYSAHFSPDGSYILTASADNKARLWDKEGTLKQTFEGHEGPVKEAIFAPVGDLILTRSFDNSVRVWDRTGRELAVIAGHQKMVNGAIFAPDGSKILTYGEDGPLKIWDTRGRLLSEGSGHRAAIFQVAYSPDGRYILSTSRDGTAKLWSAEARLLMSIDLQGAQVLPSRFTPDGEQIISFPENKRLVLSPVPAVAYRQAQKKSPFTPAEIQSFRNKAGLIDLEGEQ